MTGPSVDLDQPGNFRRTIYGRIGRERQSSLLQLYDFPTPTMHSPQRETTTSPLQQLFVMNSPFMHAEAVSLAEAVSKEADDKAKLRSLYRKVLSREPSAKELDLGLGYLSQGTIEQYAQVLLSSNEEIFWQ